MCCLFESYQVIWNAVKRLKRSVNIVAKIPHLLTDFFDFSISSTLLSLRSSPKSVFGVCNSINLKFFTRLRTFFSWSMIRQKGESQNGCFKKTKHAKFSEKKKFLPPDTHTLSYPWYAHVELPPDTHTSSYPWYAHVELDNWKKMGQSKEIEQKWKRLKNLFRNV